MITLKRLLYFCLVLITSISFAQVNITVNSSKLPNPLPASQAFNWKVERVGGNEAIISVAIAEGYYLYRDKLAIISDNISYSSLPDGERKEDPYLGEMQVWTRYVEIPITLTSTTQSIKLSYQGCQDGGVCYPKQREALMVSSLPVAQNNTVLEKSFKGLSSSTSLINPLPKQNGLLPEAEAFAAEMSLSSQGTIDIVWHVAEGYYLYADKIKVTPEVAITKILKSESQTYHDEFFGEQDIYRADAGKIKVYLNALAKDSITVSYQGCADVGVCYPVMTASFPLPKSFKVTPTDTYQPAANSENQLASALGNNSLIAILLLLIAGIALAFTPCVLPMLPILLGILSSQGHLSRKKTMVLAIAYVLGMAFMTAVFGIIVSSLGVNLQILFQKTWVLMIFALIFALAGVSMLGLFDVQMPIALQNKVAQLQTRFSGGSPFNAFIIGSLSVLVVGPCVAPPLFAVLSYASATGDVVLSGVYLFTLGLGMGLPLIGFALFSVNVPKTGALSVFIKQLLGWLLIAVALWLISRLISGRVALLVWGMWCLGLAASIFTMRKVRLVLVKHALAGVLMLIGLIWIIGGAMGSTNPLTPFSRTPVIDYIYVDTLDELDSQITNADTVLVDIYADWCIACKKNEALVFTQPDVFAALNEINVVKVDLTDTTEAHREILHALDLIGPPALIIYRDGVKSEVYIGEVKKDRFLSSLKSI